MISLLVAGKEEKKAAKVAEDLGTFLVKRIPSGVLGPAPAAIPRLRGEWRYRILLKGQDLEEIRKAAAETLGKVVVPDGLKVAVDVDPMNML